MEAEVKKGRYIKNSGHENDRQVRVRKSLIFGGSHTMVVAPSDRLPFINIIQKNNEKLFEFS